MTDRDARSLQRCRDCRDPRIFHVPQCRYKRCDCERFVEENADAILDRPTVNRPAALRPATEGTSLALEGQPAGPQPAPVALMSNTEDLGSSKPIGKACANPDCALLQLPLSWVDYCTGCGQPLVLALTPRKHCDVSWQNTASFCGKCGAKLP